jgi:threonine synthase
MAAVAGLECLRCGSRYGADHYASDCPKCHATAPSNLVVLYRQALAERPKPAGAIGAGLWRYGDLLPVSEAEAVSLGEGGTPLHALERIGHLAGVQLWAKDESRNPTWSFKDRLACMAVSVAKRMGAKAIVSSSTGNAGAAAAAYAAKAGLPCIVFTTQGAVGPLVTQMRVYGATVVAVENKADRWVLMQHATRQYGWFPTSPFFGPVVGSNPYGIEGYKTLAYELVEQMNWQVPDCCVLPVCYGDALIGMWRGFADMQALGWIQRRPRMMAAEIYGSLGAALRDGGDALPDMPLTHDTVAKSASATRSTYQALSVIRASGGAATTVGNDAIMKWQRALASQEGLYVEPASAAAVAAVSALCKQGRIGPRENVAVLLTASGLKDPGATASVLGEILTVRGDAEAAFARLRESGAFPRQY